MLPATSPTFEAKKRKILEGLRTPDAVYTDLSPKGSVDEGIRELIGQINGLDGMVTTSSCAGRISVFLEGAKKSKSTTVTREGNSEPDMTMEAAPQTAVPGGKGMGGRWLFVSHDPIPVPVPSSTTEQATPSMHTLFQLSPCTPGSPSATSPSSSDRLVRFQFEPMILHIMTASLSHAQRVLSAALNAGFRESGVQSLRALDDPNAFPMVAVRTAGLGMSSVIGYALEQRGPDVDGGSEQSNIKAVSVVSEEYLSMMLRLGNERFKANEERISRFKRKLGVSISAGRKRTPEENGKGWEEKGARAERKQREGLNRRDMVRQKTDKEGRNPHVDTLRDDLNLAFS